MPRPLGPYPIKLKCPECHMDVTTTVTPRPGLQTHIMALLLCLICCPLGLIPYYKPTCQNKEHTCPNCNAYIGTYHN